MPKGGGNQSRTHPVDRARGQTALVSVTPATPGERCAGPMVVMVETQASGQSPAIPLQETPSDTPGLDATVILEAKSYDAAVDTYVAAQCQPCGPTPTSMTPRLPGIPNSSRHPISVGVISVKTHVAAKQLTSSIYCGDGLAHQPRRHRVSFR